MLSLRCMICNAKILRVKNNSRQNYGGQDIPVHSNGTVGGPLPKSVSGYSIESSTGGAGIAHSSSNYSMSSCMRGFLNIFNGILFNN